MKRRILLVDDEVAVLLTMKAVLEISGYDVDTAASAREGKARLRTRQYDMVITDMRMESDQAGREVIVAARTAPCHPAVALLTAYPLDEADALSMGADKLFVKATHTRVLLGQLERLFSSHEARLKKLETGGAAASLAAGFAAGMAAAGQPVALVAGASSAQAVKKRTSTTSTKKSTTSAKKSAAPKKSGVKKPMTKQPATKKAAAKQPAAKR
jgi:DNA-binding response OmpR family regulator